MDTSLLKSDVFFFVTTIAVIIITALLVVTLVYVIQTVRAMRNLVRAIHAGAEEVREGFELVRGELRAGTFGLRTLAKVFNRFKKYKSKRK